MFDGIEQSWSLSRPIFGILVCHPDALRFYQQRLLASQTLPASSHAELAAKIQSAADALMVGVDNNLDHSNKEQFQTNLLDFGQNIAAFCTRPV